MKFNAPSWLVWSLSCLFVTAAQAQQLTFDASTLALANGAPVTSWGAPVAQAAVGSPTYRTNQTPNGRPAVEFKGSDRMGNNVNLAASAAGDWILVVVIKPTNTGAYHNLVDDDAQNRPMLWVDPSFRYELNFSGGTGARAAGAGPNGWDIVIADSRLNQLYVNSPTPNATGRSGVAWLAASNERWDFFHRDGGQTFKGQVAEMRLYNNRADFGGDFAALYQAMKVKWIDGLPPTANAGLDQSIHAGSTVNLDGSQSFDDDTPSAALGYAWTLVSRPAGSSAALVAATTATPSFVADLSGTYVAQLVVTDARGLASAPSLVTVSSLNQAPSAAAGDDQLVPVFGLVQLNGSGSTDPDGDALSYAWTITAAPAGSTAVLTGPGSATPYFSPDKVGSYTLRLSVSDALGVGTPDTVEVTAILASDYAQHHIAAAADAIAALPPGSVTTQGNQNALGNFLTQAVKAIQKGDIATATDKLNQAIERSNGCEANGVPDGSGSGRDWITSCTAQPPILASLRAARNSLGQ